MFAGPERPIPSWAHALFFGGITAALICLTRVIANWLELEDTGVDDVTRTDWKPSRARSHSEHTRS